jgi:prepilin-type N-terminal cleavage/methylation domain-containing protein/prepilin-type processing-associated H-X9-DG protein
MKKLKKEFTLVELLTVIAIIAILASILLPALNHARDRARTIDCAGNLKTMGQMLTQYAMDYQDMLPPVQYPLANTFEGRWSFMLASYYDAKGSGSTRIKNMAKKGARCKAHQVVRHAEDTDFNYGMNNQLTTFIRESLKINQVKQVSSACIIGDAHWHSSGWFSNHIHNVDRPSTIHNGMKNTNILFLDGHTFTMRPDEIPVLVTDVFWRGK